MSTAKPCRLLAEGALPNGEVARLELDGSMIWGSWGTPGMEGVRRRGYYTRNTLTFYADLLTRAVKALDEGGEDA